MRWDKQVIRHVIRSIRGYTGAAVIAWGLAACTPTAAVLPDRADAVEEAADANVDTAKPDEDVPIDLLKHADQLIADGKYMEAVVGPLEDIIREFETRFTEAGTKYYCARTTAETLMYLIGEVADGDDAIDDAMAKDDGHKAVVLDSVWAYAYHMKGYALLELQRTAESQAAVQKAVDLSPQNSQFLSELAFSYQKQGDFARSLDLYNSAEVAARTFSPEDRVTDELTRALRGQGYDLVEMGKLSEAESRYRAALDIDPSDELSKNELRYIEGLRHDAAE